MDIFRYEEHKTRAGCILVRMYARQTACGGRSRSMSKRTKIYDVNWIHISNSETAATLIQVFQM